MTQRGTHQGTFFGISPTGKHVTVDGIAIFRLKDGRIAEEWLTLPVLFSLPQARWWAYGLTALTALVLGAIKARYTHQSPVRADLKFLVVVTLGTLAGVGSACFCMQDKPDVGASAYAGSGRTLDL